MSPLTGIHFPLSLLNVPRKAVKTCWSPASTSATLNFLYRDSERVQMTTVLNPKFHVANPKSQSLWSALSIRRDMACTQAASSIRGASSAAAAPPMLVDRACPCNT